MSHKHHDISNLHYIITYGDETTCLYNTVIKRSIANALYLIHFELQYFNGHGIKILTKIYEVQMFNESVNLLLASTVKYYPTTYIQNKKV